MWAATLVCLWLALEAAPVASDELPSALPQGVPSTTVAPPESEDTLVLPPMPRPELAPAPPAIESPEIPAGFLGCWQGEPADFDSVSNSAGIVNIGSPGKITFCFDGHSIEVPQAEIKVTPKAHVLDLLVHFGLAYSTYEARGIRTDVYSVTPVMIHARTTLVTIDTTHWMYSIPVRTDEPGVVDSIITLPAPDRLLLRSRMIMSIGNTTTWGTWHAWFHRVDRFASAGNQFDSSARR